MDHSERYASRHGSPRKVRQVMVAVAVTGALFAGALFAGAGSLAAQEGMAVGASPVSVVLETLDGDAVDLGEIYGTRPVLLEFWATWCVVCRALEPVLADAHTSFGDQVEFITVAAAVAQSREQVRVHIARHPIPGRVLWDTRGRFTRAFDAPGTGYIVILDRDGIVAYTGTGSDQDLIGALARVVEGK